MGALAPASPQAAQDATPRSRPATSPREAAPAPAAHARTRPAPPADASTHRAQRPREARTPPGRGAAPAAPPAEGSNHRSQRPRTSRTSAGRGAAPAAPPASAHARSRSPAQGTPARGQDPPDRGPRRPTASEPTEARLPAAAGATPAAPQVIHIVEDDDVPLEDCDTEDGANSPTSDAAPDVDPMARPILASFWKNRTRLQIACAPGVPLYRTPQAVTPHTGLYLPWGSVTLAYRLEDNPDWYMVNNDGERLWAFARPDGITDRPVLFAINE